MGTESPEEPRPLQVVGDLTPEMLEYMKDVSPFIAAAKVAETLRANLEWLFDERARRGFTGGQIKFMVRWEPEKKGNQDGAQG